jgi:hypothetical protein
MRDITVKDLVKSFSMDYALIPEHVLVRICKSIMNGVIKIIRDEKGNISFRKCDIHTIYKDIAAEDFANEFMDLDESRALTKREEMLATRQTYEAKGIYTKRLRSGREIKEWTIEDVIPVDYVHQQVPKEVMRKYQNMNRCGNNYKTAARELSKEIARRFFFEVMNRLMESDRLVITKDISLYIGTPKPPRWKTLKTIRNKRVKTPYRNRYYGVVLDGVAHKYRFRMPYRRRKELRERVLSGQNFYYTPWL